MLVHKKARLALSVAGVAFSVLIMFMQLGFFNGLNDSQANLPPHLNADLVLLSAKRTHLNKTNRFNPVRLAQAAAFDRVVQVTPFYEGQTAIKNDEDLLKTIAVVAFPPGTGALNAPGLPPRADGLNLRSAVLFDRLSREIYGSASPGKNLTTSDGTLRVAGETAIGPNFTRDGYLVVGSNTWLGAGKSPWLSLGLIRLQPGADVQAVKSRMLAALPADVTVLTPEELRAREIAFTVRATPSGAVFGLGLIIGFVIGVIICYQILFNEITDHMPQYATIKAIGFSDAYLVGIVLKESLLLSILGFLPGFLGGWLLYHQIQATTRILMYMTAGRAVFILFLTVLMCVIAGFIAMKKVLRADPAEVF